MPVRAEPVRAVPVRAWPVRAAPVRAGPFGHGRAERVRSGELSTERNRTELNTERTPNQEPRTPPDRAVRTDLPERAPTNLKSQIPNRALTMKSSNCLSVGYLSVK